MYRDRVCAQVRLHLPHQVVVQVDAVGRVGAGDFQVQGRTGRRTRPHQVDVF